MAWRDGKTRSWTSSEGPDDYREFHLGLGLALKAKGDMAGALKEFQTEARENPDPSKALNEIAQLNASDESKQAYALF